MFLTLSCNSVFPSGAISLCLKEKDLVKKKKKILLPDSCIAAGQLVTKPPNCVFLKMENVFVVHLLSQMNKVYLS